MLEEQPDLRDGLTCLRCGQRVAGAARWLSTHWRAASVICLDFQGYPTTFIWEAGQPAYASTAGCVRALRVTCSESLGRSLANRGLHGLPVGPTGEYLHHGFAQWVAGFTTMCQNLTNLHLRSVELDELPALPGLAHLILEDLRIRPELVASLRGLTSLETLYMSMDFWDHRDTVCDFRACKRLRRVAMSRAIATRLAAAGSDLCLPPACTAALDIIYNIDLLPWLVQLGGRLGKLHLLCTDTDMAAVRTNLWFAPQLVHLRHVTLNVLPSSPGSLTVADLLGDLPGRVESLHLDCDDLSSEQADVVAPASLRALRVKAVCRKLVCRRGCLCPRSQQRSVVTFGLHAGLERLCLVLWESCVDLQCLDAGAPTGLRELVVQARAVEMNSQLAAEVARRGRMLERCDVVDSKWGTGGSVVPDVQVLHMGRGPVHMEYRYATGRLWHWPCTCGACAECLGPEAFGGAMGACN